jgi:hypothetical protein
MPGVMLKHKAFLLLLLSATALKRSETCEFFIQQRENVCSLFVHLLLNVTSEATRAG